MANVLFIAVRQDVDRAETLADMFEMAGITVVSPFNDETLEACDAAILVWSRAAARCEAFLYAAGRAIAAGKAISACLKGAPAHAVQTPSAFDLARWNGAPDSSVLDDLFYAAYSKLMRARGAAAAKLDAAESEASLEAANDNPRLLELDWEEAREAVRADWHMRDAEDADANSLGAGWTASLPEDPPPTLTAKRFAPKRRGGLRRFGMFTLRTVAVFAIISATAFLSSLGFNAPQPQAAERSGFAKIVADAHTFEAATEEMADVAPPVWYRGREPASAPEMADQS